MVAKKKCYADLKSEMSLAAKARVIERAMTVKPLEAVGGSGRVASSPEVYQGSYGGNTEYLLRRIARDYPDILERLQRGEFSSITAAALEAGIVKKRRLPNVSLSDDIGRVATMLKKHYSDEQIEQLREELKG